MAIDPDPDLVESLQERFTKSGPGGVYASASGWMSATVVRAAKDHAERCADCQTCHDLGELLSAVAAVQIINPPTDWLDPARDNGRSAAGSDDLAHGLLALNASIRRRTTLSLILLVALVAAVAFVVGVQLAGG